MISISTLLNGAEGMTEEKHRINFSHVQASELIRFISRITETNFVYKDQDLNFEVSMISGRDATKREILHTMITILENHNCIVKGKEGTYVIKKRPPTPAGFSTPNGEEKSTLEYPVQSFNTPQPSEELFSVYKLQFHQGDEILGAVKQLASTAQKKDPKFSSAVNSMQWIKSTNSLVLSGNERVIEKLTNLIKSLDTPQKQVFIEVLMVDTDVNKSSEFGLNWSASGKYNNRLGLGGGNFAGSKGTALARTAQQVGNTVMPQGASQFPLGKGFDLGVIGDIITHKGVSFLSLGALVSAIQTDHDSTILLNQNVIAQDNKCSKIFVGRNIPFTGSVISTVGTSAQQTTANIEYRDIGTSLNITPYIGENGMITLEIDEEITDARDRSAVDTEQVNGIETTKTNMVTRVHVPDSHFVILTGMVRDHKKLETSGLPCLGGLPWIGAAFGKKERKTEKRNIVIFVRPRILNTFEEYEQISDQIMDQQRSSTLNEEMIQEVILD